MKTLKRIHKGTLRDRQVTPRTRQLHQERIDFFFAWCQKTGRSAPINTVVFDMQLMAYAEHLWESGDSKMALSCTFSAFVFFVESLSKRLNGSWRLRRVWEKAEPAARTPPLSKHMVQGLAGVFCRGTGGNVFCSTL